MKKRILKLILVAILAMTFAVPMVGCDSYETGYAWSEDSFSLTVEASATEARIGDELEFTATFKNLSGRNLRVALRYPSFLNGRMSTVTVFGENYEINRNRNSLSRDEVIVETWRFVVTENMLLRPNCANSARYPYDYPPRCEYCQQSNTFYQGECN
ncbi:MAG: hypothetical protein FWC11_00645 [Firmicutes bacterium]|nr:hypothetical protein [Bacillota bacterium]